jgi:hypothetical protein
MEKALSFFHHVFTRIRTDGATKKLPNTNY